LFGLIAENLPQADAFAGLVVGNYPPRDTLPETSPQKRGSKERKWLLWLQKDGKNEKGTFLGTCPKKEAGKSILLC